MKIRSNLSDLGPKTPLISFYFVIYKKRKLIKKKQKPESSIETFQIFLLDLIEYFSSSLLPSVQCLCCWSLFFLSFLTKRVFFCCIFSAFIIIFLLPCVCIIICLKDKRIALSKQNDILRLNFHTIFFLSLSLFASAIFFINKCFIFILLVMGNRKKMRSIKKKILRKKAV